MEQLFPNLGSRSQVIDDQDYAYNIRERIEDARTYNDDYLSPLRMRAEELYRGNIPEKEGPGRSSIVSMEVRDTVMAMMPSLVRVFSAPEHPVFFSPNYETTQNGIDATELALLQTDFCSHIFWSDNDGFNLIYNVAMDSLRKGLCVLYWETEEETKKQVRKFTNITEEQLMRLIQEYGDAVEVAQVVIDNQLGMQLFDCYIEMDAPAPRFRIHSVKPEEFRINREAECVNSSNLVGWETLKSVSWVASRGYNPDDVMQYAGVSSTSSLASDDERLVRNPAMDLSERNTNIGTQQLVRFGRFFIEYDSDGDGIDEIHYIETVGEDCTVFHDEIVDRKRFAISSYDPEPHTAMGHSLAENMEDLQKIKTNMVRNTLDSLADTINPTTVVNEVVTNINDTLNDEIGKIIRTRGNVRDAVAHVTKPFFGDQALGIINYLDVQKQNRTGITDASKGLDPKALQSTATAGVNMVIAGAQERTELVARILAYNMFCPLFSGLLHEISTSNPIKRIVEIRGRPVPIDTTLFDFTLSVRVNPSIARGSDSERLIVLNQVLQAQTLIIEKYGENNPLVSPIEYRNTWEDIMSIANMRNVSRYFKKVTPEQLQMIEKQKQKAAQENPDPSLIIARNEQEKVRAKTIETISKNQMQRDKMESDDEFRRRKLEVDSGVKLLDMFGKYGINPTDAEIKRVLDVIEKEIDHDRALEIGNIEHEQRRAEAASSQSGTVAPGPNV